ncbi:ankyrin repeat domain-containing protein [Paraburkholderia phosphatilytica]|uniref:ankyrin repeat domain-containing protein n=1 Tax=Paraburkholderia phosphatilytica TaxID=2282883 RepID=UPI000E5047BA|nr:ankyrin repeat domain-containing protein [Paraburkholderia phosphatilytica]
MLKLSRQFTHPAGPESRAAEPKGSEARVSYRAQNDGPLAAFEQSAKGKELVRQYRVGVGKLQCFLRAEDSADNAADNEAAAARFGRFADRVEEGRTGFFSTEVALLYGQGKESLDSLCDDIDNPSIPLDVRRTQIANLSNDVLVCASGTVSNLIMATQNLRLSTGGVRNQANKAWEALLDQAIREFVEAHHGHDANYRGNEIHYVNGYRNFLADEYGVTQRIDHFVSPTLGDPERLGQCKAFVEQRVSAIGLVRHLAEMCLSDVHDHFGAFRNRELTDEDVWSIYDDFGKDLDASLADRYGKIDPHDIVNEYEDKGTEDAPYALIERPALLMRAIARNLRTAGVFETFKFPIAHGTKESEFAIKHIGDDEFYVKTRGPKSTGYRGTGFKPLYAADLPARDATPAMVKAALINTRELESLRALLPSTVWSMLEAEPQPHGWLSALSHHAVLRFREADAKHEAFLLDRAFENLRGEPSAERAKALRQGLSQKEDRLVARVAADATDVNAAEVDEAETNANSLLHLAAQYGCVRTVAALTRKTDQPDPVNASGYTPLMFAAGHGQADALRELLNNGAAVDAKTPQNDTALHIAARSGHDDVADLLLGFGADPHALDEAGDTPTIQAARQGHFEVVQMLVREGARLQEMNKQGWTALMEAGRTGRAAVVEVLLKAGAPVDQAGGPAQITPLMLAAEYGRIDALKALRQGGAKLDTKDDKGFTALIRAAYYGKHETVEALIAMGAGIACRSQMGHTALTMAARSGHETCAAALLRAGAKVNEAANDGTTALMCAAGAGHHELIRMLLQQPGIQIERRDEKERTALFLAAAHGKAACLAPLLDAHANLEAVSQSGATPLMSAASGGHLEAIRALLARGADIGRKDSTGWTALSWAAHRGDMACLEALLAKHAEPGAPAMDGAAALSAAAKAGRLPILHRLIEAGVSANARDQRGRTSLAAAAASGNLDCIKALVQVGAAIDAQDLEGKSALMDAAWERRTDVVQELLRAGANPRLVDRNQANALGFAAMSGDLEATRTLLRAGLDPNHRDAQGYTPLMYAAGNGWLNILNVLRQAGARIDEQAYDGRTALMMAARHGQLEMAMALLDAGASLQLCDRNGKSAGALAQQWGHGHIAQAMIGWWQNQPGG